MSAGEPPCPICRRRGDRRYRPFCSRRCADVDLARWFGEVYRIPGPDPDTDDEAAAAADGDIDQDGGGTRR